MKVEIESVSPVKKKLSISVPEEDLRGELDAAYNNLLKRAQIPGFRPGKVPRNVLEKKYGPSVEAEVYETLVRRTVSEALEKNEIQAVAFTEITEPKRSEGKGFSYVASVEIKPTFEPKDYKEVKVKASKADVTAEQIKEVIGRLQDAQSVLKDREGATKPVKGDFVVATMMETDDEGNPVADKEAKEQIYEIGDDNLHPDLTKAFKKLSVGETAPVTLTPPKKAEAKEDAPAPKEIHLQVTLGGIKEKVLPSVDDAFAKSVGAFENIAALREQIKKDLKEETEAKGKADSKKQILEEVVKKNPIELPESLIENELHSMVHAFWGQMQQAGIKEIPEDYTEKNLKEKMRPDAIRHIHEELVLEAIAKKEGIEVQEKEVTENLGEIAKANKVPLAEVRAHYEKNNQLSTLQFRMLAQKTLDFLLANAKIK